MKTKGRQFYLLAFKFLIILSLFCLFISQNCPVYAAQVSLGWVLPSGTDPGLTGFVVYWGNESRQYSERVDVGKKHKYTVTGLEENKTYYFALTSYYIDSHVESEFSNEVSINTGAIAQHFLEYSSPHQISTGNQPPIADAGADQYEFPGFFVTLNGSNSMDPDGDTLSYLWAQTSGPKVTLDDAGRSDPTFILPEEVIAGKKLTFRLTVIDSKGLESNDTCSVIAQNY